MNIASIKGLVESASLTDLHAAAEALVSAHEGEQLTHVLAAIYVHEQMAKGTDIMTAIREYIKRVRTSITP